MSKGKCKLCLLNGMDLQESHFVSAGIYRLLRGDGEANPNPWVIMEKAAFQTSKQQKAPLLCSDCEQRLSRNGEKLGSAELSQGGSKLPSCRHTGFPKSRPVFGADHDKGLLRF
jgi:hypothetical protein